MRLDELLEGVNVIDKKVQNDFDISGIAINSQKIERGFAFICFCGTKTDNHDFIKDAIDRGATTLIVQKDVGEIEGVNVIRVEEGRKVIAKLATNFYRNPSKSFNLIGITGTKGKTTTAYMIKSMLEASGLKVGIIGTVEVKVLEERLKVSSNTTPDAVELQGLFRTMADMGVDVVIMEVSSHALDLYRVDYSDFDIAIFTNLNQDHMDYHKNFENYFEAKKRLFLMTKSACINIDSEYGKRLIRELTCDVGTYAIDEKADITATDLLIEARGVQFFAVSLNGKSAFKVKIPGKYSVYNALGAISAVRKLGIDDSSIQKGLDNLSVPGRSQIIELDENFTVMVDYAHSPESLRSILIATKEYALARVICVFGCGGDRDVTKRPIMGEISGELADYTIITSDNPRSEEPDSIIDAIEEGIRGVTENYERVCDRALAIRRALSIAKAHDIIVIAGKGHEPYQILKTGTIHFDDKEQVVLQNNIRKGG